MLNVFENGSYRPATKEELSAKGNITVTLPYPKGTNAEDFDFIVAHMATVAVNGLLPGDIETPVVTETAEGLQVTLRGLSPVMISYSRTESKPEIQAPADSSENDSAKPEVKPAVPEKAETPVTGDTSNVNMWLVLLVVAALAALIILKKKK